MCLTKEISTLLMENIELSVFGQDTQQSKYEFMLNGELVDMTPGNALRELLDMFIQRHFSVHHMLFPVLNHFYLGRKEKDLQANINSFREFIMKIIIKRK
jgi:hypothetical protein